MSLSFRSFGIFLRSRTGLVTSKFNRAGPALIPVNTAQFSLIALETMAAATERRLVRNSRDRHHPSSRWNILLRLILILIAIHIIWILSVAIIHTQGAQHTSTHVSKQLSSVLLERDWSFDASAALEIQSALLYHTRRKSLPLTAYAEPALPPPTHNATHSHPRLAQRPASAASAASSPPRLHKYEYHAVQFCSDLPHKLPTGHPKLDDDIYGSNTFNQQPIFPLRHQYAQRHCPVDMDPFLPWVHDVFASHDGQYVEFVAHNKRRCNTDPKTHYQDIVNLEPQVTLMQPVPVKRVSVAREGEDQGASEVQKRNSNNTGTAHRYRLSSHKEADPDGKATRFICQFHSLMLPSSTHPTDGHRPPPRPIRRILGETLSVTPYNMELLNLQKPGSQPMLTRPESPQSKGGSGTAPHNAQVWNAVHHFRCPVPTDLVDLVQSTSVVNDVASIYVDVVPIRTYPRDTREGYIDGVDSAFDPDLEFGSNHVLPAVEDSGRWANVPICRPPAMEAMANSLSKNGEVKVVQEQGGQEFERIEFSQHQKHYLSACVWASAAYTTRGGGNLDQSTSERLFEWLTYNFDIAGFDHIYIYDNTAAHTNETSLKAIADLFPGQVTRIEWPHRICNNNRPAHTNTGERSSQHQAEASCRIRYGPTTQWLSNFDSDEYFIPVGESKSIAEWLRRSVDQEKKTHILSFFQTRAKPIYQRMTPFQDGGVCNDAVGCLQKNDSDTYLEAYNCEPTKLPKPNDWAWRAKKQIFRPWYVLNHFVHYSLATQRINDHPRDVSPRFKDSPPYERRVNELLQAFMLHTKTTPPKDTAKWSLKCKKSGDNCPVGIPWPLDDRGKDDQRITNEDGYHFNCYQHRRIIDDIGPKLRAALKKRRQEAGGPSGL